MNKHEEDALLADLRRRGDRTVRVDTLTCSVDEYRAGARRIGRREGWRIRTFLIADASAVVVVWMDRPTTALEEEALRRTIGEAFNRTAAEEGTYERMLEQVRRENLSVVRDEN